MVHCEVKLWSGRFYLEVIPFCEWRACTQIFAPLWWYDMNLLKESRSKIELRLFLEMGSIWGAFSGSVTIQPTVRHSFATVRSRAVKCLQTALSLQNPLAVAFQFISIMISTTAVKATCIESFCFAPVSASLRPFYSVASLKWLSTRQWKHRRGSWLLT